MTYSAYYDFSRYFFSLLYVLKVSLSQTWSCTFVEIKGKFRHIFLSCPATAATLKILDLIQRLIICRS